MPARGGPRRDRWSTAAARSRAGRRAGTSGRSRPMSRPPTLGASARRRSERRGLEGRLAQDPHPLVERQAGRSPGTSGTVMNGCSAHCSPSSRPIGAGRHLARRSAGRRRWPPLEQVEHRPPAVGGRSAWASEIDSGRPTASAMRRHDAELVVEVAEVGDELEHAPCRRRPAPRRCPTSSSALGGQRRRGLARGGAVVEGARRREAERPGPKRLGGEPAPCAAMSSGVAGSAGGAPLAHHVEAQGAVGHLGAEVDVVGPALDGVEVLGEATPTPSQALVQRRAGDVLDALHQLDEAVVVGRADRGEADAAVAHHDRGDAVPRRRRERGVPGGLAVVVGVDVDEAGRDQRAVGVDLGGARRRRPGRPPRCGRRRRRRPRCAGSPPEAVDDGTAADHQIVLHGYPFRPEAHRGRRSPRWRPPTLRPAGPTARIWRRGRRRSGVSPSRRTRRRAGRRRGSAG